MCPPDLLSAVCGHTNIVEAGWAAAVWSVIAVIGVEIGKSAVDIALAIWRAWKIIQPIFTDVWHAVRPIWDKVLKPFWNTLEKWFDKARDWWKKFGGKVNEVIDKINKWEHRIYDATFGPILDTISNLQKLLALTHLSQTAIGEKISQVLNQTTTHIENVWQELTVDINKIIQRIEGDILAVDGLLRADLLLRSIFRNFHTIWATWWDAGIGELTSEGRAALKKYGTRFPMREMQRDMVRLATEGSGRYQDLARSMTASFEAARQGHDPAWHHPGEPRV